MVDDLVLSETAPSVLRLAARQEPTCGPLKAGRVLVASVRVDAANSRQRRWLHAGDPDTLRLAAALGAPTATFSGFMGKRAAAAQAGPG